MSILHCVKRVHIRSFSGSYFPAIGLNTERYGVSLCIQSKCGEIPTRKSPNTDTFHAVLVIILAKKLVYFTNQLYCFPQTGFNENSLDVIWVSMTT